MEVTIQVRVYSAETTQNGSDTNEAHTTARSATLHCDSSVCRKGEVFWNIKTIHPKWILLYSVSFPRLQKAEAVKKPLSSKAVWQ